MSDISTTDRRGPAAHVGAESGARLLEADEVARYLGMRTDWVYQEVRAGRLPHIRLGRAGFWASPLQRRKSSSCEDWTYESLITDI
jgi:excisionase family DNA binding protein